MQRAYPTLRGFGAIATSFLLGVPGTFLIAARGSIHAFVSVTVANAFIFASFLCLYRGIFRFVGSRRTSWLPWAASIAALAVLTYNSQVRENIVVRIVAISLTVALVRGLIAVELFRASANFSSPVTARLFGASMSLFAAVSFNRAVMTYLYGAPADFLQRNPVQTSTLAAGVVSICLTGLFVLMLSSGELIARSRDESQRDALSGAFNRRGIEEKLDVELTHFHRKSQRLSIALIDLDYFKAINDVQGHAAGDAALRHVADAIGGRLRGRDHLGRYGGDEFLLILPETSPTVALVIASRLSQTVNSLALPGQNRLTLSIGVTEASAGEDARALIARADKALYQAKSDGRNCLRILLPESVPVTEASLQSLETGGMLMPATEQIALQ